jgi:sigma-B regulation protein RsbU (phosphoserine phosphatase)
MFPNATWREEAVTMEEGDLLCLYTDGVTEALDASEEEFGLERLQRIVSAPGEISPADLCRRVFDEVGEFAADVPQYDDQTLLLVRRKTASR